MAKNECQMISAYVSGVEDVVSSPCSDIKKTACSECILKEKDPVLSWHVTI
jgi:hypothetical protein